MSFDDSTRPVSDAEGPAVITPAPDVVVVTDERDYKRCCILLAALLLVTLLLALWGLLRADHADHHITRGHHAAACHDGLVRDVTKAQGELDIAEGNAQVAGIGSDRPAMNTAADTIAERVKELRAAQARYDNADTVCR